MNIQDLLEQYKLNEQTELFTPQTLRDTINKITLDDVELEEDEQIKKYKSNNAYSVAYYNSGIINTSGNKYPSNNKYRTI